MSVINKIKNKKLALLCTLLVLLAAFTTMCTQPAGTKTEETKEYSLTIATASTGGTWYPVGGAIASIITKYVPNANAVARPSAATLENLRAIHEKKVDIAFAIPELAYYAFHGEEMFKDKPMPELRALFSTQPIDLLIIARADRGIDSVEDLRGKRVGFGPIGSGSEKMTKKFLEEEYGITYDDLDEVFLSATEGAAALKDGSIDAYMYTIGTPAPTFVDAATKVKLKVIPVDKDKAEEFVKKYPFYFINVIPAGSYPGQEEDALTIAWSGTLVTRDDLPEDLVYNIVKACFEHLDEIHASHAQAKKITLETAVKGIPIPLHPGAEKYFKEVGVLE